MHLLVFYKDIYQNARSNHQDYHMSVWGVCTDNKAVTTLIVPATTELMSDRGSM
jgi:hypothetical protein